jgi:site-specific DNA-methyltransferase (adenine-specific)
MRTNILYLGDCIEIMEQWVDGESIALVYADPPYNLSGKSLSVNCHKFLYKNLYNRPFSCA